MRRALVLTNESARHPFRAKLPQGANVTPRRWRLLPGREGAAPGGRVSGSGPDYTGELSLVLKSYLACLIVAGAFLV